MAEEKKRLTFLEEDEGTEGQMENFKILIFYSNPMKKSIKVWFPLEDFSTYMRTKRFVDEICKLMGESFRSRLEYCLSEYGGVYVIDRVKNEIKATTPGRDQYDRSPKQILDQYILEHPELQESSFHEVNINNVFNVYAHKNPFKFGK